MRLSQSFRGFVFGVALFSAVGVWKTTTARAGDESFPYEAIVATENAAVFSGNGEQFYQTRLLERGTHVTVVRADPEGWRMIVPPAKAFSLVPAQSVRRLTESVGTIIRGDVSTRVGSALSGDHAAEQVPLPFGTRVTLLPDHPAPEGWLAIEPPAGEYRWIRARDLEAVPMPGSSAKSNASLRDAKPHVAHPPKISGSPLEPISEPSTSTAKTAKDEATEPGQPAPPTDGSTDAMARFDTMAELDRRLQSLDKETPGRWPLEALSLGYLRLKRMNLEMAETIEKRLARIGELKAIQADATGAGTEPPPVAEPAKEPAAGSVAGHEPTLARPDSSLRKSDRLSQSPTSHYSTKYYPTNIDAFSGAGADTAPRRSGSPVVRRPFDPKPSAGRRAKVPPVAPPKRQGQASQSTASSTKQRIRFDAVGFLQRAMKSPPGSPEYVLLSREGKILAYLKISAPSRIERFISFPVGIDGTTTRVRGISLPVISVERLTPVRF